MIFFFWVPTKSPWSFGDPAQKNDGICGSCYWNVCAKLTNSQCLEVFWGRVFSCVSFSHVFCSEEKKTPCFFKALVWGFGNNDQAWERVSWVLKKTGETWWQDNGDGQITLTEWLGETNAFGVPWGIEDWTSQEVHFRERWLQKILCVEHGFYFAGSHWCP